MADKSLTIKKATDKELNEILMRLRKEREVLGLVGDMKRMTRTQEEATLANLYGYNYDVLDVSTEKPVDNMYHSNEELNTFLHALIKSGNKDLLEHAGILGMHWGKRKAIQKEPNRAERRKSAGITKQSSRVTGKEESDFWKAYADKIVKDQVKTEKKKQRGKAVVGFLLRSAAATALVYATKGIMESL